MAKLIVNVSVVVNADPTDDESVKEAVHEKLILLIEDDELEYEIEYDEDDED